MSAGIESDANQQNKTPDGNPLWVKIQLDAKGTNEAKIEAITAIFKNKDQLPSECFDILKELAGSQQPNEVRLALAKQLTQNKNITVGNYYALRHKLLNKADKELAMIIVEDIQKDYAALTSGSVISQLSQLTTMPSSIFVQLAKLNSMPGKLLWPAFIQHDLASESVRRMLVSTSGYYPAAELGMLTEEPKVPPKSKGEELGEKVVSCGSDWREYEDVCLKVLSYCLVPPLLPPEEQLYTADKHHRRDLIFHIPSNDIPFFWQYLSLKFGRALIIDCKNHREELDENEMIITSKYLGKKKLTTLGLIITRKGINESGKKGQREQWNSTEDKMMICLTDNDLLKMLELKENDDEPWKVIDKAITDFLASL